MNSNLYQQLSQTSFDGQIIDKQTCRRILTDPEVELLALLNAAFEVRKHYFGKDVTLHILNNAANGYCPEDCAYCAQSKNSHAPIDEYPLKSDQEILTEARTARQNGAFRYCMVFSGRGPSPKRVDKIAGLVKQIKQKYPPLQVCVSTGLMDRRAAQTLKNAGLDRLNHNLNTSEKNYPNICTTHTFRDRLDTLTAARDVGLEVCSGIIAGMGESSDDIIELALQLRQLNARSIPVNFLLPIQGNVLDQPASDLTPDYCLRVLCLFRFLNPDAEIRAAAGREYHLRSMEVLALYPANSLFLQGYLNTQGSSDTKTLQMIKDAGFTIKSDIPLDELLSPTPDADQKPDPSLPVIKTLDDLRPNLTPASFR